MSSREAYRKLTEHLIPDGLLVKVSSEHGYIVGPTVISIPDWCDDLIPFHIDCYETFFCGEDAERPDPKPHELRVVVRSAIDVALSRKDDGTWVIFDAMGDEHKCDVEVIGAPNE